MRLRRLGDRLVRVLAYLLVAGSLFVALATGDRGGWRDVIQIVLFAEFVLGWGGIMLNAPIEGMKTAQDLLRGRLIMSATFVVFGVALIGALLSHRSWFGLLYGAAFVSHVRDAWRPVTEDRTPMVARSALSLMLLIASLVGAWALVGQDSQAPMLIGLVYFTLMPIADALLLSRIKTLSPLTGKVTP